MEKANKKEPQLSELPVRQLIQFLFDLYPSAVIEEVEEKKHELIWENEAGNCPVCGNYDESLVVGNIEYVLCHKHKKKWLWDFDHYSKTQWDRTEKGRGNNWKKNSKRLKKYENYEQVSGNEWLENILHQTPKAVPVTNELPF